jgi:hypothetical protein
MLRNTSLIRITLMTFLLAVIALSTLSITKFTHAAPPTGTTLVTYFQCLPEMDLNTYSKSPNGNYNNGQSGNYTPPYGTNTINPDSSPFGFQSQPTSSCNFPGTDYNSFDYVQNQASSPSSPVLARYIFTVPNTDQPTNCMVQAWIPKNGGATNARYDLFYHYAGIPHWVGWGGYRSQPASNNGQWIDAGLTYPINAATQTDPTTGQQTPRLGGTMEVVVQDQVDTKGSIVFAALEMRCMMNVYQPSSTQSPTP